jgi:hypothetical protein
LSRSDSELVSSIWSARLSRADEEDPAAFGDDGVDRLALALTEGRIRPGDGVQQPEGSVRHVANGSGHG